MYTAGIAVGPTSSWSRNRGDGKWEQSYLTISNYFVIFNIVFPINKFNEFLIVIYGPCVPPVP